MSGFSRFELIDPYNLFEMANCTYNSSSIPESKSHIWNNNWDLDGDDEHEDFMNWVEHGFIRHTYPMVFLMIYRALQAGDNYAPPIIFALRKFTECGRPSY